jgi:hypothetical protein
MAIPGSTQMSIFGVTDKIAKLHLEPCEAWGRKARLASTTWEDPLMAQIEGITLDASTIAQVVAATSVGRPIVIDRARVDRQLHDLCSGQRSGRDFRRGPPRAQQKAHAFAKHLAEFPELAGRNTKRLCQVD